MKRKRKHNKLYSKGQLNRIIDDLIHPFYGENEALRLLDGLLHGFVERDAAVSLEKFIKYNVPTLVKKLVKKK